MATINSIYYNSPGKQLFIDNNSNQFVISGYRLAVDPTLNRDLLIVNAPNTTGDQGQKGNIAFDDHHMYYCIQENNWVRGKLARWETNFIAPTGGVNVTVPTNWWNLTSNANDSIGSYNFIVPYGTVNFDASNGFTNSTSPGCLLNYTSNLIEPSTLNENFSISFEVKRINNGFLMGNAFGKLGFHFEFVDALGLNAGPYLRFRMSAHVRPFVEYRWVTLRSSNIISDSTYSQIIAINNASTKQITLYVNGDAGLTTSYASTPLQSMYDNPSFQGWAIGANPNGSYFGNPVTSTEYYSSSNIRYMGFWKGKVLTSSDVSYLYNGGSFRRYPFV